MEYYSSITRNEVLIDSTTWMNLKNIMLSERSQTKGHICMISLYEISGRGKSKERENRLVVVRSPEEGNMRSDCYRYRISF